VRDTSRDSFTPARTYPRATSPPIAHWVRSYSGVLVVGAHPVRDPDLVNQTNASTSPNNACAVTSGPAPGPWITSGCVL